MSFVSTGFQALNSMIAGNGECRGFPRGGLTLIHGAPGSGKSQVLRDCCSRAHKKGLSVVYVTSDESFPAEYSVVEILDLGEATRFMASLLHPGKRDKTDLLVLDSLTGMTLTKNPLEDYKRKLGFTFHRDFGQTAVVGTCQSRRIGGGPSGPFGSSQIALTASIILVISKVDTGYHLELSKSRVSTAGVSCLIRPTFDRSTIPTRYQRILRGRN